MSRSIALIAALAILELSICTTASMSENSSSADMPANTESISETAESEQPAKLIDEKKAPEAQPAQARKSKPMLEEGADESLEARPAKAPLARATRTMEPKTDTLQAHKAASKDEDKDESELKEDKEVQANAYMSHDDSRPSENCDPLVFYQAGCRAIKQKKYQLALEAFNRALELNPRYYEASYRKALVYQLTGYDKYAARRYQDVLKYRPDMDEARINLAALHRKHKHYTGAEEQLRSVLQHNFASFEAHYNLANVLVEAGKPEEALKEYKTCLKMKPNNPMVHNNLGVLFLERNYPEEALQEFRRANQIDPKNATFISNVGTAQKLIAQKKNKGLTM